MGESGKDEAQWLRSALPLWELHSCKNCECLEPWLERQTSTKLGPQDTIRMVLNCKCLKCPCIVHLNLICMSYDQKKGRESNCEFDSQSQIPWKQGSNEVRLGRDIHHWKIFLKVVRYCPCILKIYMIWERYEHLKFWNSKSPKEKWHWM